MAEIVAVSEGEPSMPTLEHGEVIAALIAALRPYVLSQGLGRVFAPQTTYHLPGIPARDPDASFIRRERLPKDPNVDPDMPPDVAVEVVSRTDTFGAVNLKVTQYLDVGVRMVWLINPDLRTVDVYQPGEPSRRFNAGDTLAGDPVIPGFALPVSELFTWD